MTMEFLFQETQNRTRLPGCRYLIRGLITGSFLSAMFMALRFAQPPGGLLMRHPLTLAASGPALSGLANVSQLNTS